VRIRLIALIEADTQPTETEREQQGRESLDTLASQLEPLLRAWSRENRHDDTLEGRTALAILHWPSRSPDGVRSGTEPERIPLPAWAAGELVPPDTGGQTDALGAGSAPGMPATSVPAVPIEVLSGRELEVLRLVAAGLSNREIAAELFLSVGTVKQHLHHINGKLGTTSRTGAIARGRQFGLL